MTLCEPQLGEPLVISSPWLSQGFVTNRLPNDSSDVSPPPSPTTIGNATVRQPPLQALSTIPDGAIGPPIITLPPVSPAGAQLRQALLTNTNARESSERRKRRDRTYSTSSSSSDSSGPTLRSRVRRKRTDAPLYRNPFEIMTHAPRIKTIPLPPVVDDNGGRTSLQRHFVPSITANRGGVQSFDGASPTFPLVLGL